MVMWSALLLLESIPIKSEFKRSDVESAPADISSTRQFVDFEFMWSDPASAPTDVSSTRRFVDFACNSSGSTVQLLFAARGFLSRDPIGLPGCRKFTSWQTHVGQRMIKARLTKRSPPSARRSHLWCFLRSIPAPAPIDELSQIPTCADFKCPEQPEERSRKLWPQEHIFLEC